MNDIIDMPQRAPAALVNSGRMSAMEVVAHTAAVQEVMRAVMKPDVHYGKIPGTPKPALYKAGAEVLCMAFRIADEYRIDDLSTPDMIRYRVTCVGKHQTSGVELGSGMGEASTGEEKYKWRGAVCDEEFEITPATMRRVKFGKKSRNDGGGFYKANQVRTEPSDLANTVLKMACKRAKMAMVLNVTAASDIFSQDLDELDETLRDHLASQEGGGEPVLSTLAQKWMDAANAAKTAAELTQVWKDGVKEINAAKDVSAQNAFKAVVEARGPILKAQEAAQAQSAAKREPGSDDADLEADFRRQVAREQGGQ
jgi:hypothetical protein